jgi:hypothetical protein
LSSRPISSLCSHFSSAGLPKVTLITCTIWFGSYLDPMPRLVSSLLSWKTTFSPKNQRHDFFLYFQ